MKEATAGGSPTARDTGPLKCYQLPTANDEDTKMVGEGKIAINLDLHVDEMKRLGGLIDRCFSTKT